MKGALIGLFAGIALLVLLYFRLDIYISKGTIDIYLFDTYFVLSYVAATIFVLLFLATTYFIGGFIGSFFKRTLFLILGMILFSVDVIMGIYLL